MAKTPAVEPGDKDALIVVDVQYDFLPGGALAVQDGDAVIAPINGLARVFRHVVLTQDWHPKGHASFASSHPGRQPFELVDLHYGPQVLWPDHCVQGTSRATGLASEYDSPWKVVLKQRDSGDALAPSEPPLL